MPNSDRSTNMVPTLLAKSNAGDSADVIVWADPTTHRLLVDATVSLTINAEFTDDAAFTPGTSKVLAIGATFDDTGTDSVDEGDVGIPRMSANRNLYVRIRDNAGNERGLNIDANGALAAVVTNAGTFAVQVDGAALTSLQLIDDAIKAEDVASQADDKGMVVMAIRDDTLDARSGTEGDYEFLHTNANGALWTQFVNTTIAVTNAGTFVVQENGSALTALQLIDDGVYTDDTSTHSTGSSKGYGIMAVATPTDGSVNANDFGHVAMTTDRKLHVAVMDALPAGTNAIGKLSANSGVDIGDVDVTSIIPGTGATNLGKAEDAAHTSGDTGVMDLGVRVDTPNATVAANGDYHYKSTDMVGGQRMALYETDFAVLGTNHVKKYYTSAGAVTDGIVWSPAAGKRWYVTDIFINISAAATITLEDDKAGGDEAIWKAELAANSGWSHSFTTPWFSGEDAADLIVTTTAGNIYIMITGYEI